ncbi:MAG: hypothetical protein J6D47_18605 [Peptostreptococcaceae bacterium]|nr:hypothetical protein [Peptostreptococcaceae bacterium]MBP3931561.1 hypothetical protein [Peptostreptococcaceae bacterium]
MRLYYLYGTMNSAKSLNLLAKAHQFEEVGNDIILMKPFKDSRDKGVIKTRAGLQKTCYLIHSDENIEETIDKLYPADVLFVDEVQFLSKEQINQLWRVSRKGTRVFCYGLKTSANNELFEASKQLLIMADRFEEIISQCQFCNCKATTHIKIGGNSEDIEVGDIKANSKTSVRYESVCQNCYEKHTINQSGGKQCL